MTFLYQLHFHIVILIFRGNTGLVLMVAMAWVLNDFSAGFWTDTTLEKSAYTHDSLKDVVHNQLVLTYFTRINLQFTIIHLAFM